MRAARWLPAYPGRLVGSAGLPTIASPAPARTLPSCLHPSVAPSAPQVGVMYFIGAGFWTIESLWSMWVYKLVYRSFRGQGMTAAQVGGAPACPAGTWRAGH